LVNFAIQDGMLETLRSNLVFGSGFDPYVHKPGTALMRRGQVADIAYVADSTTLLTEGTPPTSQGLVIATSTITAVQRGIVLAETDLAEWESPYDLVAAAQGVVSRWAAEGLDLTAQAVIDAAFTSSTVVYSGTATSRVTTADKMTGDLFKRMVARLRQADVQPFADGYYRAALSPRAIIDLQSDTAVGSFTDVLKYADASRLLKDEVGEFAGARIMSTTRATTYGTGGASSVDVVRSYVWGKGFIGLGDTATIKFYLTPPGGQSDPLHQQTKMGAKFWLGATTQGATLRGVVAETAASILAAGQA
jgi:N4-gp56 family major capsid protein